MEADKIRSLESFWWASESPRSTFEQSNEKLVK